MAFTSRIVYDNFDGVWTWDQVAAFPGANGATVSQTYAGGQDVLAGIVAFKGSSFAYVQGKGLGSLASANVGSFTVAFPSNTAAGNTIVVDIFTLISTGYTVGVTDSQGNTYSQVFQQQTGRFGGGDGWACFVSTAQAGANTVTVTATPTTSTDIQDWAVAIHEYSGITGVDTHSTDYVLAQTDSSSVSPSLTTTGPNELVHLFVFTHQFNNPTVTPPPVPTGGGGIKCTAAWLEINEPQSSSPLTTAWTDQSHRIQLLETMEFGTTSLERGTAQVTMIVHGSDSYLPTIGSQVCLWDLTADENYHVWTGTIDDYDVTWHGNDGTKSIAVSCVSLEQVFDTIRLPDLLFENKTCGFIFTALLAYATGSPVGTGTIQDGPVQASFQVNGFPSIASKFGDLATLANFVWGVDPATGNAYFTAPSATPAAWDVLTNDLLWESFSVKPTRHDYRNRQILKLSQSQMPQSSELFVGANQKTITLKHPVDSITQAWIVPVGMVQNTAVGTFTGIPTAGDTISIGIPSGNSDYMWSANTTFDVGAIIVDPGGMIQQCTVGGGANESGATEPTWNDVYLGFTTDNTLQWQCMGPAGFQSGALGIYTWVANLVDYVGGLAPNAQFGYVVLGADAAACAQNLSDAINRTDAVAGITFSLPTWENPLVNADEPSGGAVTVRNKPAGAGYIAALSKSCANFTWSATQTSGGTTLGGVSTFEFAAAGSASTGGVYTQGSPVLGLDTNLTTNYSLQVQYFRVDGEFITCEDTYLLQQRALIEDGTGKYQALTSDSVATKYQGLLECQSALLAYDQVPTTFQFSTLKPGLLVGQILTVDVTDPEGIPALVNGTWFIQELRAKMIPAQPYMPGFGHYKYTVTCIDTAQIGSWIAFWEGLGGSSSGGSQGSIGSGSLAPTSSSFPLDFSDATLENHTFAAADTPHGQSYQLASFLDGTYDGSTFTGRFSGAVFKNASLRGCTLTGDFEGCDFSDTTLTGATLTGNFMGCDFSNVSFGSLTLSGEFIGCNFSNSGGPSSVLTAPNCNFSGSDFTDFYIAGTSIIDNSLFNGCTVFAFTLDSGTSAIGTVWAGVQFIDSTLDGVDFSPSTDSTLAPSDFSGCSFVKASVDGTNFTGADLGGTSWWYTNTGAPTLAGCNFTGARFCSLDGSGATGWETIISTGSSYALAPWDCNKLISATVGSPVTAITLTLPAPADISATWQTAVQNASAGAITVDPNGGLIDGVSGTLSLSAGAGLQLYCDGSNYFTERGSGGTGTVNKYDTSFSSVTSLTVTHGLGTLAVQVSVYDSSGNLIVPSSVEVTGINTVAITFGSSTTGSVVVIG
jgi:uncharacterized protein YjbI with pentapeptide repeats